MSDAKQKIVDVSPQLVELVAADGTASQPVLRAQAFMLASELFGRRGTMSTAQQIQLMESYAKLGNLVPKQAEGGNSGGGFSISITLPGHESKSITINAEKPVEDNLGNLSVLNALEAAEAADMEAKAVDKTHETSPPEKTAEAKDATSDILDDLDWLTRE